MKKKNQGKAPATLRGARTALTQIHATFPLGCNELGMKTPECTLQPGQERGTFGGDSAHVRVMDVPKNPPLSTKRGMGLKTWMKLSWGLHCSGTAQTLLKDLSLLPLLPDYPVCAVFKRC